eukprot:10009139-Heterocapsa_arctica.AAC.1
MHASPLAKQIMACRTPGLLLIDKGEIERGVNVIKKMMVNWLRQTEGGLHTSTAGNWKEYDVHTGQVRGPVNDFRTIIKQLGWTDNSPTNITDHRGQTRDLDDWQEFVYD